MQPAVWPRHGLMVHVVSRTSRRWTADRRRKLNTFTHDRTWKGRLHAGGARQHNPPDIQSGTGDERCGKFGQYDPSTSKLRMAYRCVLTKSSSNDLLSALETSHYLHLLSSQRIGEPVIVLMRFDFMSHCPLTYVY